MTKVDVVHTYEKVWTEDKDDTVAALSRVKYVSNFD